MAEARREPRKAYLAAVKVLWEDPVGEWNASSATIEDLSEGGVSIRIPQLISVGLALQVKWRDRHLFGVVRNSRREGRHFLLGIQVSDPNVETPEEKNQRILAWFKSQH